MEKRLETLVITKDSRPWVVEISNRRCNVRTFSLSMSKRHKMVMLIDLFIIGFIPAMTVWCVTQTNATIEIAINLSLGMVALVGGIGKTICDFACWMFTMNKIMDRFGEWYVEDITNICNDFIKAGCKVAGDEVAKVLGKNDKSDGESNTPETKAEQDICA